MSTLGEYLAVGSFVAGSFTIRGAGTVMLESQVIALDRDAEGAFMMWCEGGVVEADGIILTAETLAAAEEIDDPWGGDHLAIFTVTDHGAIDLVIYPPPQDYDS